MTRVVKIGTINTAAVSTPISPHHHPGNSQREREYPEYPGDLRRQHRNPLAFRRYVFDQLRTRRITYGHFLGGSDYEFI